MKLLEKDELRGIDSTSKTIDKWDEFLKKAVWNMGYSKDLIDHMYPYEKGIPLISGEYMPVDKKTGRVFFKLSWADMLAGILSCIASENPKRELVIAYIVLKFARQSADIFSKMFPTFTADDYSELCEDIDAEVDIAAILRDDIYSSDSIIKRLWEKFIDDSDISQYIMHTNEASKVNHGYVDEEYKDKLKNGTAEIQEIGGVYFIFNRTLENEFSKFPRETMRNVAHSVLVDKYGLCNCYNSITLFDEVYCSEYFVISLNPIDKLMCSTKQAFSSCMSLAKQNDTHGTNSTHAFGLPALFPSDKVFLVFTTPGKHKNMYWEKEEWEKAPEDRDPDKAYKYLKMSCRALTYKGTLHQNTTEYFNAFANMNIPKMHKSYREVGTILQRNASRVFPERERLFVGRQYAASGEDYRWQGLIEVIMARQGISTSMAYAKPIGDFFNTLNKQSVPAATLLEQGIDSETAQRVLYNMPASAKVGQMHFYLRIGKIDGVDFACLDRFGFKRGIYFDNITFELNRDYHYHINTPGFKKNGYTPPPDFKIAEGDVANIHVGSSRRGIGSFSFSAGKTGLDAFLIMTGKQNYNYYNDWVKVCHICGKAIAGGASHVYNGSYICDKCMDERHIKRCDSCGTLYSPEEAEEHEIYNIMELLNPNMAQQAPVKICRSQLKQAAVEDGDFNTAICAHCGKIETSFRGGRLDTTYTHKIFHGIDVKFRLCSSCVAHAALCEKCKRLIFLDTVSDACLLLPNRRIICPDCIDSIRAKKEKKDLYKEILSPENIVDTVSPEPASEDNISIADEVARLATDNGTGDIGNQDTRIKDPSKQILSYLQSNPQKGLPALKPSNPPITISTSDTEEVVTV